MNYEHILDDVPAYKAFYTVDELNDSSRRLAESYPGRAEWMIIGRSRKGEEIPALRIGNGSRTAVLFAMPHPNEPIGALTLDFLSWRLVSDPDLSRELDFSWYLVKCIDPDGARLNEGWFKGPFTLEHYARHYYRPPSHHQIEWTFPIQYKSLRFDKPLPETEALMNLIGQVRPSFMYSLHNCVFGGAYFYVSDPCPPLYDPFARLVGSQGLPLHRGEPETPFMTEFAPAIFRAPTASDIYDYYAANQNCDPAEIYHAGTSSFDYACRAGANPFGLIVEMPYFYSAQINDQTPTEIQRRVCILEALDRDRRYLAYLQDQYDKVRGHLSIQSPFRDTLEDHLRRFPAVWDAEEHWARTDHEVARPATVAEVFDSLVVGEYWRLLHLSTFLRMVKAEIGAKGLNGALRQAYRSVERAFNSHAESVRQQLPYQAIPIQKLVRVQLGAGLQAAEYVCRNG